MILGIDVVFIHAKDPVKLSKWYEEILEIEIGFQNPYSWQEYELPRDRTPTRFAIDYVGENPSQLEQQPIMISFKVEKIHGAVEKLESKGIAFFGKNTINDVGPTLVATLQDIEGNWIQLSQKKNE